MKLPTYYRSSSKRQLAWSYDFGALTFWNKIKNEHVRNEERQFGSLRGCTWYGEKGRNVHGIGSGILASDALQETVMGSLLYRQKTLLSHVEPRFCHSGMLP